MTLFFGAILFVLGAVVASFVGVVVVRYGTGESILYGRSRCDACGRPLPALALVPILSFVASRGRAQCCGAHLSPLSTLAEGSLGALFVLTYGMLGLTFSLACFLIALAALLALVEYDLVHQVIPLPFVTVFIIAALAARMSISHGGSGFESAAIIACIFALFFATLHFLSGGRLMGLGDTPVVFGLAILVGAPAALPGFAFSFWIGAVIGIMLLLGRPPGTRMGVEVPLAPFLALGFLLAFYSLWNPFAFVSLLPYAL